MALTGATMTRYELARDKRITLAAIIGETAMVVSCVLLCDAALEHFGAQTPLASHVSLQTALTAVLAFQYFILAIEGVARYRSDNRGLTIPLAFLPGGIIARAVIIFAAVAAVASVKLLVYFLSVLAAFVLQIFRLDRRIGTGKIADLIDRIAEPAEHAVNRLYNLLCFNKINANSSVFAAMFNGSLSLWCINH